MSVVKKCPVCGFGYRGSLKDHLDRPVEKSETISRCDWNLNRVRVDRAMRRLRDEGWIRADSVAARILKPLQESHPHLVRYDVTGSVHPWARDCNMGPKNDPKIWWTKPWARALADMADLPGLMRRQYIIELDEEPDLQTVVEATYRIGGTMAVAGLGKAVFGERCSGALSLPAETVPQRGEMRAYERCRYRKDHTGKHLGMRGSVWA